MFTLISLKFTMQALLLWLPLVAVVPHSQFVAAFSCQRQFAKHIPSQTNSLVGVQSMNGLIFQVLSKQRRITTRLAASDGEGGENRWFFNPPTSDVGTSTTKPIDDSGAKLSPLDLSRIKTMVKLKPESSEMDETTRPVKKIKPQKATTRNQPSPLSEMEENSVFFDMSNPQTIFGIAAFAGVTAITAICYSLGLTLDDFVHGAQTLFTDPQAFSQSLLEGVKDLGPTGVVYFALIYMIAEILAVPATPLTLSAGYLFGIQQGILAVLAGATGAACIGFWISRTFLREYVESTLLTPSTNKNGEKSSNTLLKLDRAIGEEGFKLLVLIRLSPIFPFSVTNYLYGASSMGFGPYILGTLIGFVPTTAAYVYTGMVGQALTGGGGMDQPWYVYAGGFAVLALLVKLVTDVATGIIEAIDDES